MSFEDIVMRSATESVASGKNSSQETNTATEGTPVMSEKAAKRKERADALREAREEESSKKVKGKSRDTTSC